MAAYLVGASCISPQPSFTEEGLATHRRHTGERVVRAVEPVYRDLFTPAQLRRMGRLTRMAVAAALRAMARAGAGEVDAVVTGTGLGCFEESERFLLAMIARDEQLLNPSVFIQATHHAASSQVAFSAGCRGYHVNYTHRGFSFESALLDALLLVDEGAANRVLVGGMDEIVPAFVTYLERAGLIAPADAPAEEQPALGEGATFFVVAKDPGAQPLARVHGTGFCYRPVPSFGLEERVASFLADCSPGGTTPDLVLLGDTRGPWMGAFRPLLDGIFRDTACGSFFPLCGVFHTASAFACWLATAILREGAVPPAVPTTVKPPDPVRSVLILTHHEDHGYAWTLLGRLAGTKIPNTTS